MKNPFKNLLPIFRHPGSIERRETQPDVKFSLREELINEYGERGAKKIMETMKKIIEENNGQMYRHSKKAATEEL